MANYGVSALIGAVIGTAAVWAASVSPWVEAFDAQYSHLAMIAEGDDIPARQTAAREALSDGWLSYGEAQAVINIGKAERERAEKQAVLAKWSRQSG